MKRNPLKTADKLTFALRIALGWLYAYAGISKLVDPSWSAAGYLNGAKTFVGFYHWLASPAVLPITNFIAEWGLTLLGISLLLGIGLRISCRLGAVLMLLFYFPILSFPFVGANSLLVDEHVIFAIALLLLAEAHAGSYWGLERWREKSPLLKKDGTKK